MSSTDILGYAASATVLASFCMRTMLPLRIVAIFSNVLFAMFGALAHIYPVLVLHVILCPINVVRLFAVDNQRRIMADNGQTSEAKLGTPIAARKV